MATFDLEEQEQIDEAKAWWKQHGNKVIWGVTLFLLAAAGWRAWETWSRNQSAEASMLYEQAMQAASMNELKQAKELAAQIMEKQGITHPGWSAYATPAAWLAGRINLDQNDLKSARAQFQFALDHARDDSSVQLARIRLAGVMLDDKDAAGALKVLEVPFAPPFTGLAAQVRGDVLVALGKMADARAAYLQARDSLGEKSALKPLVEMRLDALGG